MQHNIEKTLEHGQMKGVVWNIDGIIIGYGTTLFTKKAEFTSVSNDDMVRLHFGVKGDYRFTHKQLQQSFDLIGGHHNLMYSKEFEMTVHNKTLEIETFGVTFPKTQFLNFIENTTDDLKTFGEQVLKGNSIILSNHWGTIDASMQKSLNNIKQCHYVGDMQKIALLSQAMDLLMMSTQAISTNQTSKKTIISKQDKEKIIAARDFINSKIHHPPTLTEISKQVGLNEFKLKLGFKELFKTTLFNYLTEQRLHLAYSLLQNTAKTAVDVSAELGYATPQHFNNAFKKKYKQTPLSIKNNPKNAM